VRESPTAVQGCFGTRAFEQRRDYQRPNRHAKTPASWITSAKFPYCSRRSRSLFFHASWPLLYLVCSPQRSQARDDQ
jgi:hypothetical protein